MRGRNRKSFQPERSGSVDDLATLWRQVSLQHFAVGAACGCGMGFSLSPADIAGDLTAYLSDEASREQRKDVLMLLERAQGAGSADQIEALLGELAVNQGGSAASFIVERLRQSLQSLADMHGGRFVCA